MAATLLNCSGMLQGTVLTPPHAHTPTPRSLEMSRDRLAGAAEVPASPVPGVSPVAVVHAGGGAGWVRGRLYQARIPCNVEIPAFPCGMGVCTEFKSPTPKFMKLLPAAEGCMVCMEG